MNGIRLWPSTSTTYTPTDFIWQGSDDGSSYTNVITVVNAVHTASEYSVYYGYFSSGLFSHYRATISGSSSSSIYTYELQPLVCNIQMPTNIEYPQSSYTAYATYESVLIRPVSTEWTGCTISPTPSAGLTFDSSTCTLSGSSNEVDRQLYGSVCDGICDLFRFLHSPVYKLSGNDGDDSPHLQNLCNL